MFAYLVIKLPSCFLTSTVLPMQARNQEDLLFHFDSFIM